MGAQYQALRGMEDLLPGEVEKWQWVEAKARIFLEAAGYQEIRTPLLEPAELFTRSLGEGSDIVHKEMYAFEDRGGRRVALRPEMTASVARAVIENHLLKKTPSLRLYYLGPMFRGERPQAGRKRQFHQIGIERINEAAPAADAEVLFVLSSFLKYLGLEGHTLCLNHLGCALDRPALLASLKKYFSSKKDQLCSDCRYRLEKNVLRIFDCKNPDCQPVILGAPWEDFCTNCRKNFEEVRSLLSREYGLSFKTERRLVRGIDYYTGPVFEVTGKGLGAQDVVAGGGRYDGLYEALGGGAVPATGFSIGVERLVKMLEEGRPDFLPALTKNKIYFASLGTLPELRRLAREQALLLCELGFSVATTPEETSLSAHLKRANQAGARYAVILGEDEFKRKEFALKDLAKRTQQAVPFSALISTLRSLRRA